VLVVQPVEGEPSVVYSACADGHVLRWELDADLNADSYRSVASHLFLMLISWYCCFDQDTDNPGRSVEPSWLAEDVKPPPPPLPESLLHVKDVNVLVKHSATGREV